VAVLRGMQRIEKVAVIVRRVAPCGLCGGSGVPEPPNELADQEVLPGCGECLGRPRPCADFGLLIERLDETWALVLVGGQEVPVHWVDLECDACEVDANSIAWCFVGECEAGSTGDESSSTGDTDGTESGSGSEGTST
jgi:hypothetical protein